MVGDDAANAGSTGVLTAPPAESSCSVWRRCRFRIAPSLTATDAQIDREPAILDEALTSVTA
jgi:hypothetical protein